MFNYNDKKSKIEKKHIFYKISRWRNGSIRNCGESKGRDNRETVLASTPRSPFNNHGAGLLSAVMPI